MPLPLDQWTPCTLTVWDYANGIEHPPCVHCSTINVRLTDLPGVVHELSRDFPNALRISVVINVSPNTPKAA